MKTSLDKKIILFDGVCNLCNGAVNFIIDRDLKNQFLFTPLQSEAGQQLLAQYKLPLSSFNSLVLLEQGQVYQKSTGALRIAKTLRFPWSLFYAFMIIPPPVRNFVYDLIAKYRYKLFGKSSACRYPSDAIKAKFLTDIN